VYARWIPLSSAPKRPKNTPNCRLDATDRTCYDFDKQMQMLR
jgi:hypothetical protein